MDLPQQGQYVSSLLLRFCALTVLRSRYYIPPTALKSRPRPSISVNYLTNVLSMSKPPTASRRCTSITVYHPTVQHDPDSPDSHLPSIQRSTKPITPEEPSSCDKKLGTSTPIKHVRQAATSDENSPLLSERESIFATHYLPSDGGDQTPRLPAAEGADNVANLPQHLNITTELALPSSPPYSAISLSALLSSRKSRPSQIVNSDGQKTNSNDSTPSTTRVEESNETRHTVRRVASEGHSVRQILQLRVRDKKHSPSFENLSAVVASGKMNTAGNDGEEQCGSVYEHGHTWHEHEHESARNEAFRQTGSNERSASRGRARVEKSIEATLPDRDSTRNVRTRKSSHLMGIFKETASSEAQKRDGQSRTAKARHDRGRERGSTLLREDSEVSQLRSKHSHSRHTACLVEEPSHPTTSGEVSGQLPTTALGDVVIQADPYGSTAVSDSSSSSPLRPVSPSETQHDPYFRRHDEIKSSMSDKRPVIPAKLLEDIRSHHNLTAPRDCTVSLSRSLPSVVDVDKLGLTASPKDYQAEDGADHDEEDEEHISSAVYFPHPRPSDEDIEQFTCPDEEPKIGLSPTLSDPATSTPKPELKRTLSDIASSEHIDISVRSKHEESVFHGDYRPSEQLSEEEKERDMQGPINETTIDSASSASSASECEISSGEELSGHSQASEGEVTPTSAPTPQSQSQKRKRNATTIAPRGAVVLEPYSHQVGGHSTMFRFSRRAVCKQLNNRENEFYERIEQRHPDMLRFLPRLVTAEFCLKVVLVRATTDA